MECEHSIVVHYNKITSPRACVLLFRRRKSFIFISCSSDWLYANEFVLGVRNCRGKKNFAARHRHCNNIIMFDTYYTNFLLIWNSQKTNVARVIGVNTISAIPWLYFYVKQAKLISSFIHLFIIIFPDWNNH